MDENEIFTFEFHSLIPAFECKTVLDADTTTSLKIFGRTKNFESTCANIIGYLPYFYISTFDCETDLLSLFDKDNRISALGITTEMFKLSLVERVPFYNYFEGTHIFLKVECCSEMVRKKMINFVKDLPNQSLELYEAHISFSLQFMSDFGITGMGLVHVFSPFFPEKHDKTSSCNLECIFNVKNILNPQIIKNTNSNNSLIPSLSFFMNNLGIDDTSFSRQNLVFKPESDVKISSLWPPINFGAEIAKSAIKSPSFKQYVFHIDPPSEVSDFFPIDICENRKSVSGPSSVRSTQFYQPVIDPPIWENSFLNKALSKNFIPRKQIIEPLTLNSLSKSILPFYDFNGDFYLKFIALDCYEDSSNFLIAISFTIFHENYCKTYILCTKEFEYHNTNGAFTLMHFFTENEMIEFLIKTVISEDPDILVGFEVDNRSWGYVSQRYNILNQESNFEAKIGRSLNRTKSFVNFDPYISRASSNFQSNGRIVLNLWKIYKDEVPLRLYTLSEICKYYFNIDAPSLSSSEVTKLMHSDFIALLKHIILLLDLVRDLTIKTQFLVKSIEFSRLFGIDLFSTLTRGSQYRVESILISAAHSENFLLKTPTESDVRSMRAAQGIPLTMEPISDYYRDPVVVLDFQSLYPSLIIAYNFCYSTVFGTVMDDDIKSCGAMSSISPSKYNLESFSKIFEMHLFKSPGSIVFANKDQKVGLLPRLLNEILTTRVAIKKAMKSCDSKMKSVLDARQLGLKYISNLTYGYTSASFSGRMPNVDIADAIVISGRKTLEWAIDKIESHKNWEAKVVYGDTDSLFILLRGRSLSEAFRLGKEMADLVTSESPAPMALKFEKVYFPCILMSKKRYCGLKYDCEDSKSIFDAKGIETVRRDGCLLVAKILKKSLSLLFSRNDENLIKEYVQRQLIKILSYQKINISDFVFAREVRFGTYKSDENNKLPLSAIAAKNRQIRNSRDLIAFGQRVPYVIVSKPFSKLYQKVVDIEEFLNKDYKLDVVFYCTKQILTVLSRAFFIQGIDVWKWYHELPLAQLKQICNPRSNSIFGLISLGDASNTTINDQNISSFLQEALKLQDLNRNDLITIQDKLKCCGNLKCQTWTCKAFWSRFNFEHCNGIELSALRKKFDLNF